MNKQSLPEAAADQLVALGERRHGGHTTGLASRLPKEGAVGTAPPSFTLPASEPNNDLQILRSHPPLLNNSLEDSSAALNSPHPAPTANQTASAAISEPEAVAPDLFEVNDQSRVRSSGLTTDACTPSSKEESSAMTQASPAVDLTPGSDTMSRNVINVSPAPDSVKKGGCEAPNEASVGSLGGAGESAGESGACLPQGDVEGAISEPEPVAPGPFEMNDQSRVRSSGLTTDACTPSSKEESSAMTQASPAVDLTPGSDTMSRNVINVSPAPDSAKKGDREAPNEASVGFPAGEGESGVAGVEIDLKDHGKTGKISTSE